MSIGSQISLPRQRRDFDACVWLTLTVILTMREYLPPTHEQGSVTYSYVKQSAIVWRQGQYALYESG